MKREMMKEVAIFVAVVFFVAVGSALYAADKSDKNLTESTTWGKFNQGTQGHAKEGLEDTAGKKTTDVKVPDVPKPTKAN